MRRATLSFSILALVLPACLFPSLDNLTPAGSEDGGDAAPDASSDAPSSPPDGSDSGPGPSAACAPLPAPTGRVFDVSDVAGLVAAAASAQQGETIQLADGTYALDGAYVLLARAGVTLRSRSGARDSVVLDGAYRQGGDGQTLITITASNVTVAHLTLKRPYDHGIQVDGSNGDVVGTRIHDVHVVDPGHQAIKLNGDVAFTHAADQGTLSCSHLELTDVGRQNLKGGCFAGGVIAYATRGWGVHDNVVEGFWCPSGLADYGIHFWQGARDTVVERNVVKDCARGIGFGLGDTTVGRTYPDDPCPGTQYVGAFGGIVRNNFVAAGSAALFGSDSGFDSGMALELACGTRVVHNTVASTTPPASSSIEWRFAGTNVTVTNNLVTSRTLARDGADATTGGNVEGAPLSYFANVGAGDLHLTPGASLARDKGVAVGAGVCDQDIDGDARSATTPDVGADEVP